jgi:hypothetical protein
MAALGNNSLEMVDLKQGKVVHSVTGLHEPQGVAFIPQTNEIIVANGGNGHCMFYDAKTFEVISIIDLGSDADDVRYDSIDQRVYVGYGEGGIAIIDARNHQKIADVKLPAHPEGFEVDRQLNKVFVNVPDAGEIDVIDLKTMQASVKWKTEYGSNFPMTIDVIDQVIFIGFRHPAKLTAISAVSGNTIGTADLISDVDDLYFDDRSKKIYASGGGGAINIFTFKNSNLTEISNIPTRKGARTSLLISPLHLFVLAERANSASAQLQVFTIQE